MTIRSTALAKIAKAAAMQAEASKLMAEASVELEAEERAEPPKEVTDKERAGMRRRFRAMGHSA